MDRKSRKQKLIFNYLDVNNSNKKWEEIFPKKVWTPIVKEISYQHFISQDLIYFRNLINVSELNKRDE